MKSRQFSGASFSESGRRADVEPKMTLKELQEIDLDLHPDAGMRRLLEILEGFNHSSVYESLELDLQREWAELEMDARESIRNPLVSIKPLEIRLKRLLGILEEKTEKAN